MQDIILESDIDEICKNLEKHKSLLEGRTIVFAGAGGFLGRYFLKVFERLNREYLVTPCKVIAYDNFITGKDTAQDYETKNITLLNKDICEGVEVDGHVDFIIQAAGIASPYYYRAYPLKTVDVSIIGTRNLLDLAKEKNAKLVFFSSSEIYGDPDESHLPTSESYRGNVSCLGPRACYDESKRLGETLCRIYATEQCVHTNMIRPFNIYGPGMLQYDYRVLPNFASCLKSKEPLKVYGSGRQTRTFCYITDAIYGFFLVLMRGVSGEPYNVGNPNPEISMLDLAHLIKSEIDPSINIKIIDYPDSYPADEPNRRCPDITKAIHQLEYRPVISLKEGITRFLTWADSYYKCDEHNVECV